MKASGVKQELLDEIGQVLTWPATEEQIEQAMRLVPDDVVQMITASAAPQRSRRRCANIQPARLPDPVSVGDAADD
jgi:5,10-methylenetetrahydromethanopterin reductase